VIMTCVEWMAAISRIGPSFGLALEDAWEKYHTRMAYRQGDLDVNCTVADLHTRWCLETESRGASVVRPEQNQPGWTAASSQSHFFTTSEHYSHSDHSNRTRSRRSRHSTVRHAALTSGLSSTILEFSP
jgi:hypothetical protein